MDRQIHEYKDRYLKINRLIHINIYIYIYVDRERERERERERDTDTLVGRWMD